MSKVRALRYHSSDIVMRGHIIQLLTEAFGDYQKYYQLQLELLASSTSTRLLGYEEQTGYRLISHIQIAPYNDTTHDLKVAYLYAICTAQTFRGRGIMSEMLAQLIDTLPSMGYDIAALVPASKDLERYYFRLGFITANSPCIIDKKRSSGIVPINATKEYLRQTDKIAAEKEDVEPTPECWMYHPLDRSDLNFYECPPLISPLT